ncbi:M61 family metallopeptidase [Roseivirga sp. E12]|uniref:M61 family metallopeptidase n=1 Tax=Roseivirga sp. E12 TaxID=2819237 RepID=UPI001ABCEBC3|nr:PDZ domain-containing protein [Roseivirga sp. E12]MBO3700871.1 M61 family metallopeptidase [Roseivirga sp. E12]
MDYHFSFSNPNTHYLIIKATFRADNPDTEIFLPNWRPGRYQIQNFAKRIRLINAFDETDKPIALKKSTKGSWRLTNKPGVVTLIYEYYAFEMDAGNSWLDDEQLYINPINCCIYTKSSLERPSTISFDLPEHYEITSGLEKAGRHQLYSPNYYRLVDSPIFASGSLRRISYKVGEHLFNLWIQGSLPRTDNEVINDFKRFTEVQIDVMGEFPCSEYHFLFQCLPYKHYHGVEHWNSTVITIGPSGELAERARYKDFLGVSSHELFHTWNVIRLRPVEMTPYDFQNANYHKTGFVTEGVTTYYGDLFLVRSKVYSLDEYLEDLNKMLKRHYENEGRKGLSVADSSFDLWLDGYEKGIPGRKVSIYNEGALAALILDLMIRSKFNNGKSLDDVMRLMWSLYGRSQSGYTFQDYKNAAESIFEDSLNAYFDDLILGNQPFEDYLSKLTPQFGLDFQLTSSTKIEERVYGFKLSEQTITDIAENSPAQKGLSIGDRIESINGKPFESRDINPDSLKLQINRFERSIEVDLKQSTEEHFSVYQLSKSNTLSDHQHDLLQGWLNSTN